MKKFIILSLVFLLISCTRNKTERGASEQKNITYSNEFFSIDFPSSWSYEEDVNTICDTVPEFSKGYNITIGNTDALPYWHTIRVQKSAMFKAFNEPTPEKWRDLSMELKQFDESYIGTVESYKMDSLYFGPYPAALAGFVVVPQPGDTIIQKQLVVLKGDEVYYLNNNFDWRDDGTLEKLGDSILCSIRFLNSQSKE